jgi:hypothetical protein
LEAADGAQDTTIIDRLRTWSRHSGGWPTQIDQLATGLGVDAAPLAVMRALVAAGYSEPCVVAARIALFAERYARRWGTVLPARDRLSLEHSTTHLTKRRLRKKVRQDRAGADRRLRMAESTRE